MVAYQMKTLQSFSNKCNSLGDPTGFLFQFSITNQSLQCLFLIPQSPQWVLLTCPHCRLMPGNGYGHLTFYKPLSVSFQKIFFLKTQISHCWNTLCVRYRFISHVLPFLFPYSHCPFDFLLLSRLYSFPRFPPARNAIAISSGKSKCLSLPQGSSLLLWFSFFIALSKTPV